MKELGQYGELADRLELLYEKVGQAALYARNRAEPWNKPLCSIWTRTVLPIMRTEMATSADSLKHVVCDPDQMAVDDYGLRQTYHEYLADMTDYDDPLIIDGTWQQFSKGPAASSLPKILLSRASSLGPILSAGNVPQNIWYQWQPQSEYTGTYYIVQGEKLIMNQKEPATKAGSFCHIKLPLLEWLA